MKISLVLFLTFSLLLSACGLKYTPTETREDFAAERKNSVSQYIRDSYKDSSVVYQSLVFGQPTLIKPYHHRQLDSLYEIKYTNELSGRFDKNLEEKINNQKIVVANSSEKVKYIEHHIYSIQTEGTSNVYYADISFDSKNTVTEFVITQTYQFPSNLLAIFKSYITRESIMFPNYGPTSDEQAFYEFFETELAARPSYQQNEFMTNMLNTFLLARNIRSIETKQLLQQFSIIYAENRQYGAQIDVFHSINGVWEGEKLLKYEVNFTTPAGTFNGVFSPYFELISMEKLTNPN